MKFCLRRAGLGTSLKLSEYKWQPGIVNRGRRTYFDNCVSQNLSGAGSSPGSSVGRDLNLQKLNY